MSIQLKKRLIGLFIVLTTAAIALPLLFHTDDPLKTKDLSNQVPTAPPVPNVSLVLPKQTSVVAEKKVSAVSLQAQNNHSDVNTRPAAAVNKIKVAMPISSTVVTHKQAEKKIAKPKLAPHYVDQSKSSTTKHAIKIVKADPSLKSHHKPVVIKGKVKPIHSVTHKSVTYKRIVSPLAQDKPESVMAFSSTLNTPPAWVVQLASFSNHRNAHRLVARLKQNGYDAYARTIVTSSGKKIIRVFVGPEISKATITQVTQRLNKKYKLKGLIKRYKI